MSDGSVTVSVVVPARNAEATLGAQLEALARQRAPFTWEVLVADNGSTDATREIAARWVDRMPLLRVVDASARRGASAARNIGAGAAHGGLLLFCDADDVVDAGWIEHMAGALVEHDLTGGVLENRLLRRADAVSVSWEASAVIHLQYWTRFEATPGSSLGIRRAVFDELGGFDERLIAGEDVDVCWRAQIAGHSFGRARGAITHSRPRAGLRAIYRQAYGYGEGHRQLRRKYAAFIAADAGYRAPDRADAAHEPAETTSGQAEGRRSLAGRLRRLVTPSGLADLTWRVGQTLGERLTRADRQIAPLALDEDRAARHPPAAG